MKIRVHNNSGDPRQPGNALRNKNFDKATFRILGICVAILLLLVGAVYLLGV